ncbi:unnamed protein product [Alopecurus aequalis]
MFFMDSHQKLNILSLAPQLGIQEVPVVWGEDMVAGLRKRPWLVVCGDKLLMVDITVFVNESSTSDKKFTFYVFSLDLSAKPAKWVKVDKLENWALFVSAGRRSQSFSCMSPERWGGKSNCIYIPIKSEDPNEPWIAIQLGQSMYSRTHPASYILAVAGDDMYLENFWVLPSLFYGGGS